MSRTLAKITSIIAAHSLFEMTYLKTARAITDVAAISKLLRSDTFAELVDLIPNISSIGAAISRITIATVYGSSFFCKRLFFNRYTHCISDIIV